MGASTHSEAAAAPAPNPGAPGAGPVPPPGVPATDEEGEGVPVHGSLLLRTRARWTGDASDVDAYALLGLDVGDPERHDVTVHALGRLWWEVSEDDPDDVFFGLDDTFGSTHGILYYGYADVHGIDSLPRLRVGRQQLWQTPAFVVFDGLGLEAAEWEGVTLGAYGGLRAQYYETSSDENDFVGGVYALGEPWDGGRLRLDFLYLEDEQRLGSDQDELLGAEVRHFAGEQWTFEAAATALEGDARDVRLVAHWLDPEAGSSVQVRWYDLLQTQRTQALEVDPYFTSLRELFPYRQLGVLATQGLGERYTLGLGVDVRRLHHGADEGVANHEFERYYANVTVHDALVERLDVTLTGDVWRDDQQDVQTWGLDLTREVDEDVEASLGSYWSLWKYDLLLDTERDDVRTYYGRVRWQSTDALGFELDYELEDDDYEVYHRVRVGARWLF